jgi:hypothetical protein
VRVDVCDGAYRLNVMKKVFTGELAAVALCEETVPGVFRLHIVVGFAADYVPLKMTVFWWVRESRNHPAQQLRFY